MANRWLARGFHRFEIKRVGGEADVAFQFADIDGLICPGCVTAAERGVMRPLSEIAHGLLTQLEDPTPRSQ